MYKGGGSGANLGLLPVLYDLAFVLLGGSGMEGGMEFHEADERW